MRRTVLLAACAAASVIGGAARADMAAPPSIAERVALSEVIVVGKATGFADKLVAAKPPWGGDKADYQAATVQVGEALLGAKDVKEIKVGFIPPAEGPAPKYPRRPKFVLAVDQEALLFLRPHADADFYAGDYYYNVVPKKDNPQFDKDLDQVKRCVKLLADPAASLKSKDANERLLTAAMLVTRYRTPRPGGAPKTEDVGAEESKLILQALADADWDPAKAPGFGFNPAGVFARLGVTEKDGFTPPPDFKDYPDAAKKWLKDNADKYRVQKFVADKKDK
jgi:hypothetical protein